MMANAELIILLSWAAHYTGYPTTEPPVLKLKSHEFFVETACGGVECNVLALYTDVGIIYLDQSLDVDAPETHGIVVHELVHYLQDVHGDYDSASCQDSMVREVQAYSVQDRFMADVHDKIRYIDVHISCTKKNTIHD